MFAWFFFYFLTVLFDCLTFLLDVLQNVSAISKQTTIAWSSDYSYLATGSDDGLVYLCCYSSYYWY